MLGSNHLLIKTDTDQLLVWVDIIETCVMYLLDGVMEEAFSDYEEYIKV